MRFAAAFLDVKNVINLSSSVKSKKHCFLVDGAVHIAGSENLASFLAAKFGKVA